jgi:hypothetical protein
MKHLSLRIFLFTLILLVASISAWSQTCQNRDEIPEQTRTAIENAAQQTVQQAIHGDVNSLRANIAPSQQSSFNGIAATLNDNKAALEGARPQLRSSFLLDTGATPSPDGRFYCGVFGATGMAANGAEFDLPGLSAGKYAVVIEDLVGNKGPYSLTTIFQDVSGWKVAGLYIYPQSAVGHDGIWYLQQARDYKNKGQNHNAWFYYVESWELMAPVRFMETTLLGNIIKESNSALPKDVPSGGKSVSYSANGKTYNITDMSVFLTEKSLDLSIKYSVPSTADFAATAADARNLANAYVSQYPELKDAFNNVWAHAIDPNGGDVPGVVVLKPVAK